MPHTYSEHPLKALLLWFECEIYLLVLPPMALFWELKKPGGRG